MFLWIDIQNYLQMFLFQVNKFKKKQKWDLSCSVLEFFILIEYKKFLFKVVYNFCFVRIYKTSDFYIKYARISLQENIKNCRFFSKVGHNFWETKNYKNFYFMVKRKLFPEIFISVQKYKRPFRYLCFLFTIKIFWNVLY